MSYLKPQYSLYNDIIKKRGFTMKEYIFLGLLAVWVLGLAIAFIAGMIHDFKNNNYEQVNPANKKDAKKRIIWNIPFIAFGIFLLVFRTSFFYEILSTNSFIPGLLFVTTSTVQIILGIFELIISKEHEAEK